MTDAELKIACCGCAAEGEHREEAEQSFDVAKAWLTDNPIAVGCSARDADRHRRKCERYVVATRQQACGFAFSSILMLIIGQVISALFGYLFDRSNRPA